MGTQSCTIDLDDRSYNIHMGAGLLDRAAALIPHDLKNREIFIVCDGNVENYAAQVQKSLNSSGARRIETYVLESGEQTKSFEQTEKLCQWLLTKGVTRSSLLIALGGGVVGDLAGFCASIIMRGILFVQIPTTLLAQVDSSVGGKTGINTKFGKNLVGSFYQPIAVIADINTLKTLPRRELLAGYAEIAKYGLINAAKFFAWLETNGKKLCDLDQKTLLQAIDTSVKSKAAIVQADERESGQRALLNLGHTFGHALETVAGYDGTLLHGEAVAIGICMAFDLSARMGLCPPADAARVETHFKSIGLPTDARAFVNTNAADLFEIMQGDKKASGGKINFILARGIGDTFISNDVPEKLVLEAISKGV